MKIQIKRSNVAGKIPTTTDLEVGELAINFKDKKFFTKNPEGNVIELKDENVVHSTPLTNESKVSEIVFISQADYDALGIGRPADKLYVIKG